MIKVENLVKKYGTRVAVKDLSFTVQKGQIYGFLGPNGAGKTTTMNIMTGYLAATSGTVTINGYDIQKQSKQAKKCIGYLPEIPPLYPDMTVLEYLRFVTQLKSVPKEEQSAQIQEIMDMVGIVDVKTRLIKNLSKGYKQRVGLAQAIIGYPEVIILDEPMVGLDPKQILETRSLIKRLSEQHTIILSSHILSEISTICDHILIIAGGALVASGSPEDLQKLMDKSTQIAVTVSGTEEKAREVISGIEQVQSFELEAAGEEITIKIITKENADIRKELSVALTNADMPVLAMNKVEKSLEDIFIQLTDASHTMEAESDVEEEKDDSDL
ncbi:MAG: ABC transporter ATP-binding protein [Clostridium sp.]|nr:ABC transporter ATP-binding protein [Clostridium sp.]